jgi:hypothetical protein
LHYSATVAEYGNFVGQIFTDLNGKTEENQNCKIEQILCFGKEKNIEYH